MDDPARITCAGMPPLKSGLGKWAQRVVAAEEWMEARLSKEFVVDNSNLKASTVGIAFRLSKNVDHRDRTLEGPYWGDSVTGLDAGDGWVRVGRRYLPRALSGQPVLLPASALGNHLARVGYGGLTKACSIDAHGVVHGAPAPWISRRFPGQPDDRASCRKRFHEKLAQRRRQHATGWSDDITLCVDAGGKASIYLTIIVDRMERRRCKAAVAAMRAMREKAWNTEGSRGKEREREREVEGEGERGGERDKDREREREREMALAICARTSPAASSAPTRAGSCRSPQALGRGRRQNP